jgi:acyl-CoA thioesterase
MYRRLGSFLCDHPVGMLEDTNWLEQIPTMPINYGYDTDMMGFLKTYGHSTISLTMEIRKDPKGAQWLLQRAVMNAAKNGRFDLDVKIIDEDGELVASVCQVNMLIPLRKAVL